MLNQNPASEQKPRGSAWSRAENLALVADYLEMLQKERRGEAYSKAQTRKALVPQLNNRSEGSIEMKRMNVSGCLAALGLPYIAGYKPATSYQKSLLETVEQLLPAFPIPAKKEADK